MVPLFLVYPYLSLCSRESLFDRLLTLLLPSSFVLTVASFSFRLRRRTLPLQTSSGMLLVGRANRVLGESFTFYPSNTKSQPRATTGDKLQTARSRGISTHGRMPGLCFICIGRSDASLFPSLLLPPSSSASSSFHSSARQGRLVSFDDFSRTGS